MLIFLHYPPTTLTPPSPASGRGNVLILPTFVSQADKKLSNLTKIDAVANAWINAGRLLPSIDPVITEVTFLCHTFFRIELHHSKRTGFKSSLTSDTNFWINEDNDGRLMGSTFSELNLMLF
jgi:hypothetical protein